MSAMKVSKTVMKKPAGKVPELKNPVIKKPAGNKETITPVNLANLKAMTIEEKMNHYQNNKKLNQDGKVDSFLNLLEAGDRQAIWQSFAYQRRACKEADDQYNSCAKGPGSDPKKKQLLHLFLTTGRNCKSKAYLEESIKLVFTEGSRLESEWVPFASILKKYGIAEAMRRLKKGSIAFRKDADDPEEMQFKDSRVKTWSENAVEQSSDMSKKGDLELKEFLQAKMLGGSPLAPAGSSEELALFFEKQGQGQSQSSKNVQPAVEAAPVEMSDDEGTGTHQTEPQPHDRLGKKADELSQVGKLASKKVGQRLQDMLKVCNGMKSHIECESLGKNMKKDMITDMKKVLNKLAESATDLKKHMMKTVSMEKAKNILTASAKAINDGKVFANKL